MLSCHHFQQRQCGSCQWLELPYPQQLARKQQHLQQQLAAFDLSATQWIEAFCSELSQFRNKAKMVVSGSVERPILGIVNDPNDPQSAVDLCDCPLYPSRFQALFPVLKDFIARAGLVPYNLQKRKGELKYILLTESRYSEKLMLRFVLRSEDKRALIERELAGLLARLPQLAVVSLNIQPQHAAILEGEQEVFLTKQQVLEERFNGIPLFIRPQGFFQTNPQVASALYHQAQDWLHTLPISNFWDLFCGVGGFGLHCLAALRQAQPDQIISLTGIEISASAIASARLSLEYLGLSPVEQSAVSFQSLDSATFAIADESRQKPQLVIVNPPRRGIGSELAAFLNDFAPDYILYSSCNAVSMGKDLALFRDYQISKVRLFDMFPHTRHYEVLVLLQHKASASTLPISA
ncbi:23S rRNA (uracil(747)-C(5))-methyltransferase RlmC [Testudinibacter sp. TR-2022]|uniref:23S rRNA (uracil(747)-C(5))-methyltransferase RlmC n=2 Tax=Testudinibacter sp. TR-2022 TaxID=2585029 RepID=UPI001118A47F|nr:23S rRNA (uracil(747)-C(5))-methyltransferase RlmC [Testudinibacter sp. TR-2022]TNH05419.1 23S rRNA (uracil(747)-C(5))-methyltransferase RlmC [Pasteurellaceae bacterium Phil31]TNH12116.1 23S rRNA (uracil(747)-C(5))-methyltransferase RlmC [Testudinibacter sp. TR-2022]TNH13285.1 23S rRNA (uracil(747)-C(5))-methyltransferase RlmC [Testudinibacter sp. TR-2022]TNH13549.1 23S rRNA (uracil(747)-C(5))-methyltransferase RlmC [Testudinibacter sp. TR-2022]